MAELDTSDKRIVGRIQQEFPLISRPYAALGAPEVIGEDGVLTRVAATKDARTIRQISATFDICSLGRKSSLVAMRTQPEDERHAFHMLNKHPGVNHNYKRDHDFNI